MAKKKKRKELKPVMPEFIEMEVGEKITCEILEIGPKNKFGKSPVLVQVEGEDEKMYLPTHTNLLARPFKDHIGEVFEIQYSGEEEIEGQPNPIKMYDVYFVE